MPGRDGTGPAGYSPMTGGRRGFCSDAALSPGRDGGRSRRNQCYAHGLTGWHWAAQGDAQAPALTSDASDPLARVEGMFAQVLELVNRLESATRS